MDKFVLLKYAAGLLSFGASVIVAAPLSDDRPPVTATGRNARAAGAESAADEPASPTYEGQAAAAFITPAPPVPDSTGIDKCRFISFSNLDLGATAIRVTLLSLHHVDPPYPGGVSAPFTLFEGQTMYVGPPTQYVESTSSGTPFMASVLQCAPHYQDWKTVGLLHVTGEAIVPSSIYEVQILAAECLDNEAACKAVSAALAIKTTRWGNVAELPDPADPGEMPEFTDINVLINKFQDAPGAPIKPQALLAGDNEQGLIDLAPDVDISHVAAAVDAFKGLPYPYKPGRCTNNPNKACVSDFECSDVASPSVGSCALCGIDGGACCHGDGTCDMLLASACNGPNDTYMGDETPCSRCSGPASGCAPLTNAEWLDAELLWSYLDRHDVCKEAEETPAYNCVAWTVGVTDRWIWDEVDLDNDAVWEVSDFNAYFAQLHKSAIIYGSGDNAVFHTARPLPNNGASSKAGEWIRMRHDRSQLEGGYYGDILATYMY